MNTQGCVGRCGVRPSRLATGCAAFMVVASPLITSKQAQGEVVTLHVSGTVTSIGHTDQENFDFDGSVVVGSPYQLTFVIETSASDLDPDPERGRFLLIASSGSIGNYTWSKTAAPVYEVETANNLGGNIDRIQFGQPNPDFAGTFQLGGVPAILESDAFEFIYAGAALYDTSMSALQSDSLVVPELNDWDSRYLTMHFNLDEAAIGIGAKINVRGTVDGINMPEPSTLGVVSLLIIGVVGRHRKDEYTADDPSASST